MPTFKSSSCAILPFLYHKTTLLNSRVLSPSSLSYVRMSHVIYILQRNNVQTKARAYIKEHFILFWPRYKINIGSKKFIKEIKISTLLRLRGNGMYFFCLKNVQGIKFKFIMEANHNLKRQVSVHNAASSWIFLWSIYDVSWDILQTSNVRQSLIANAFQFLSLLTLTPQKCGCWYENSIIFQYRCRLKAREKIYIFCLLGGRYLKLCKRKRKQSICAL